MLKRCRTRGTDVVVPWGSVLTAGSVVTVAGQLFGLYRPAGPPVLAWFPYADKVGHVLGFALPVCFVLLTASWFTARRPAGSPDWIPALVVTVFAGHAVASELIQARFYPGRAGDAADALADCAGIALGAVGWVTLRPALLRRAVGARNDP